MTYIIPNQQTKQHSQTNKSDISGTIYQSRNITLDEQGYIKLSDATYAQFTTDDDADFDTSDAMYPSTGEIFMNSDNVFSGDLGIGTLTDRGTDTNAPTPNVEEDVIYFNSAEVVSDGTLIKYRSAPTTWTTVSSVIEAGNRPACMAVWDADNTLAVGSANKVRLINSSWGIETNVLTLQSDYEVFSMVADGSPLYIATRSKSGGDAKLFVASRSGINTDGSADYSYSAGTFEIMSVKRFKSSVVIINSLGQLMRFNGGGFDELASLPIYATGIEWNDAQNDYSTVSNRAMWCDGDLIYINLSSLTRNGRFKMLPNFHSGIWCYDDTSKSLYHRHSPSYTRVETISGANVTVSTTNNNFTLTSGNLNNVSTGMPVLFDNGSGTAIPELKESVCYFLIKDSSTVFKLAESYDLAIAGTAIDITNAGNVSQNWYVYKVNDYGWAIYDNRMAVCVLNNLLFDDTVAGRIAYTAELGSKQAITTSRTVFGGTNPFIPNRGYFTTPRLNSTNIEDVYNTVYVKFRPLGLDDKIIIKAKTRDRYGFPFTSVQGSTSENWRGVWTSTTVFTTTADLSDVIVGDEIEIIAGVGSGHVAHVYEISVSTGTYTVTLTEAFPFAVSNDQMRFQVDCYKILGTLSASTSLDNQNDGYVSFPIFDGSAKTVQIKVELRGIGVTIEELIIDSKKNR